MPAEFRTAVVIPTLFGSVDAVHEALENLEVQFLANREAHLHFARAERLHRRAPARPAPDDEAIVAAAVDGVRALNARYGGGRRGRVLPLPPPAPMESARGRVDGMGAEARQARRVQPLRPRPARATAFSVVEGDLDADAERALRHHPRLRHRAPAGRGAAARRRHGAPAQPRRVRPRARPRRARLRDPAAARRRFAPERASVAVRVDPLGASGRRSVHHGGVRRLSGPLRRGELHRERRLRRRRLRAAPRTAAFPRTPCSPTT